MHPALQFIYGLAHSVVSGNKNLYEAQKVLIAEIAKESTGYTEALEVILEKLSTPKIGYILADLGLTAATALGRIDLKYNYSHRLALLSHSSGRYEKAIDLLRNNIEFLENTSKFHPARKMLLVREYFDLAHVFNSLGCTDEALQNALKGIALDNILPLQLRNSTPEYRFVLADACNTVGCVYKEAGKIEEALYYFFRSSSECAAMVKQSVDDSVLGMLRELMSGISNNLGLVYERLAEQIEGGTAVLQTPNIASLLLALDLSGRAAEQMATSLRKEALTSFERALRLIAGTGNRTFYCYQLQNLAIHLEDTEPKKAVAYFLAAKEEATRSGLPEVAIYASTRIARCYYKEDRTRAAYFSVRSVLNEIESLYVRQRTLPVRNRILSSLKEGYELAAQCCFDLSYLNKALGYIERIKARGLLNQMMNREFSHALDESAPEGEETRMLSQFGDFLLHQFGDEKTPSFPLEFDKHGIKKARRLLGLGHRLLIEMFFTTDQLICLLIGGHDIGSGNELAVIRVPTADRQWMREILKDFWFTGYAGSTISKYNYDKWLLSIQTIGSQLGEKIWTALGATIEEWNPRHLVFVPHLGLQFLPLHLIPLDNRGTLLLDRFDVSYAPSLSTLSICKRFRATRTDRRECLLFLSNPTKDLGFADHEATFIGDLFDDKIVLLRDAATAGAFHSWSKYASIVHFACHGGFSKGDPSTSLLQLADRALTVQELGAKAGSVFSPGGMAVLSACESGIVALDQVDEFIGLPYGFLAGGCSTVISSLWPVDDMATAILMERFYLYLVRDRLTKPEALAQAQRWVRDATNLDIHNYMKTTTKNSRRELDLLPKQEEKTRNNANERPFAHPFFWGSFVCHGYWD